MFSSNIRFEKKIQFSSEYFNFCHEFCSILESCRREPGIVSNVYFVVILRPKVVFSLIRYITEEFLRAEYVCSQQWKGSVGSDVESTAQEY